MRQRKTGRAAWRRAATVAGAVLAGVAATMLTACHNHEQHGSDEQRAAAGEVLSGSVSDSMIPYDALTSEPPVATEQAKGASGTAGGAASPGDDQGAAAPADSGPGPAQVPGPAPADTPTQ